MHTFSYGDRIGPSLIGDQHYTTCVIPCEALGQSLSFAAAANTVIAADKVKKDSFNIWLDFVLTCHFF